MPNVRRICAEIMNGQKFCLEALSFDSCKLEEPLKFIRVIHFVAEAQKHFKPIDAAAADTSVIAAAQCCFCSCKNGKINMACQPCKHACACKTCWHTCVDQFSDSRRAQCVGSQPTLSLRFLDHSWLQRGITAGRVYIVGRMFQVTSNRLEKDTAMDRASTNAVTTGTLSAAVSSLSCCFDMYLESAGHCSFFGPIIFPVRIQTACSMQLSHWSVWQGACIHRNNIHLHVFT